jgi:DNA-binding response OmpR family regulator
MRQKRILIVEDDADVRRFYRTILAMAGYDVEEAGDGVDALRLIENNVPDLIVLDLMLHSLDGVSVQQELAAGSLTARIPIVVVTGSTIDTTALNVACVLHKPVMPDELVNTVKQCMASAVPAAGA